MRQTAVAVRDTARHATGRSYAHGVRRVAAVAVLALVAAGCSGDEPAAAPTTTATAPTATTAAPEPSTTAPAPSTATSTTSSPAGPAGGGPAPAPRPAPVPAAPCDVPPGYPEPWPDRPRYTAHLGVEPGKRLVTGDVTVRFVPDAGTDRLIFRLWPNAPRIGRAGGRLDVTASQVGGQPVTGRYETGGAVAGKPGTIWVLPGAFPAGQPVEARLEFGLRVPGAVNDRVATAGPAVRLGSVIPTLAWIRGDGWQTDPATHVNAESAASEVADWDVTVTAPPGHTTLATGEETSPGRFVARAVRDWAATVGPMRLGQASAQGGRTTVVVGVTQGAGGDPDALAARNARSLDELAARFGEYPYPRLTIGVTTGLTGGIEFPTHIFLGSGVATFHLVHEVAHQWFYALVGNDQFRDPWLDEGLAKYAEARVEGQLAYHRGRALPAAGRGRLGEPMAYWARIGGSGYYVSVYIGGLQALAKYGDRVGGYGPLDCALRRYVRDRAYAVARPADLLAALAAQTGVDPRPILAPLGVR